MSDDNVTENETPTVAQDEQPQAVSPAVNVKETAEYKALLQESIERRKEIKALKEKIAQLEAKPAQPETPAINPDELVAAVLSKIEAAQAAQTKFDADINAVIQEFKLPENLKPALKAAGTVEAAKEVAKSLAASGRFDHITVGSAESKEVVTSRINKLMGL